LVFTVLAAPASKAGGRPIPEPPNGPGVEGQVTLSPVLCRADSLVPCPPPCPLGEVCTQGAIKLPIPGLPPYPKAAVEILDPVSWLVVGRAITNTFGNFIVSVPAGDYLARVQTPPGKYPSCPDVKVTVNPDATFTSISIDCDSGIRY
jgi:hypothetical protein